MAEWDVVSQTPSAASTDPWKVVSHTPSTSPLANIITSPEANAADMPAGTTINGIGLETPPGWERGTVLPVAQNTQTGEFRPAIPGFIRDPIVGIMRDFPQVQNNQLLVPGLTFNPETGSFGATPEASSAISLGARPLQFGRGPLTLEGPGTFNEKAPLTADGTLVSPQLAERTAGRAPGPGVDVQPSSQVAPGQAVPPAAPVTNSTQAKQIAGAYYDVADKSGGTLTPQFTDRFIDSIAKSAPQTEAGTVFAGANPVTSLVERAQALKGQPLSIQAVQEMDEALSNQITKEYGLKGLSKDGQKLQDIQMSLRDQIRDAQPGDVGGGANGFAALDSARQAWSQAMKMGDLERIQERANLTDNPATSIKTQVRTLLTNATKVRGYSDEERAALQDAAERGTLGNVLHVFGGRLIPWAAGLAGLSHGGPITAAIEAGAAHAATTGVRGWATALQTKRLQDAMTILGRSVPPNPLGPTLLP